MKNYIIHDPWHIIEAQYRPEHNEFSESIFSIGNGRMGQRGNFEENFSGKTLSGSYIAGVYYPDKTRVGWWKNGYPAYFAKVINSVNWIGLHIKINGETLDLVACTVQHFERRLDMKHGILDRSFIATLTNGIQVEVKSSRMYHMFHTETAALQYHLRLLNADARVELSSYLSGDVFNRDSNYDEKFWKTVDRNAEEYLRMVMETKKTNFLVETLLLNRFYHNSKLTDPQERTIHADRVSESVGIDAAMGDTLTIEKRVSIVSSTNHERGSLYEVAKSNLQAITRESFEQLKNKQHQAWQTIWKESDIQIEGDIAAQQAIRFNIFQLHQTYTGEDARLNIGPKGFTGEKYGGVTYWDTEAYCLPFYLSTQDVTVARNLLLYRYQHLQKAIENASKLGFKGGAALYPMVTINGEECHNEWEITFEEIHRNGAIAFAIFNYIRYTGDIAYLLPWGLEVLIAISRFWSQRVNWSVNKQKYVILGVTGPNEYENNVNNNWYTNTMAAWCLRYTLECLDRANEIDKTALEELMHKLGFSALETEKWRHIVDHLYYPDDKSRGIFLQQDDFLDKELIPANELPLAQRPLNQHWSWDRILRSCYIKQADVLQGLYFFEGNFDMDTIRRNYEFYEPLTVHESSLSPCVHCIIAAKLGKEDKAYEFYLRTARLDLDDYNNDTEEGLHITSMAGTWLSIVEGFAGMRVYNDQLHFKPFIPSNWESYAFHVQFRGVKLYVKVSRDNFEIKNLSESGINLIFNDRPFTVEPALTT
ncbi:family 65 glycosyl hydrolase domain-containing protein [Sphingobacterium suaedae]|uniref:Family 65 glycosyl hydrolase domain-containing protein n=1 Tax=Sphingobacterium suaedae TaxID=1686402 RepID=A0ABW5KDP1_9SPHI